jgi:cytochrome c biogenesis protein CcmG/thiol:disulfide interchange protein DsbE
MGAPASFTPAGQGQGEQQSGRSARRLLWPLVAFAVLAALPGVGLTLNPRELPSPLLGRPVPEFALEPVKGRKLGLAAGDLRGDVSIVNLFASWCTACRDERLLPLVRELQSED